MDALVPDLAIAKIPNPVPASLIKTAILANRSRTTPSIPIESLRNRSGLVLAMTATHFVGNSSREIDVANDSLMKFLDTFDDIRRRLALSAVLDDSLVRPRRFDHFATFEDVV